MVGKQVQLVVRTCDQEKQLCLYRRNKCKYRIGYRELRKVGVQCIYV